MTEHLLVQPSGKPDELSDKIWSAYEEVLLSGKENIASYLPDFLVVSPPKCATTWLSDKLDIHPEIDMPIGKETRYFDLQWMYYEPDWYSSLFKKSSAKLRGEACPSYSMLPESVISLLARIKPSMKLIVSLRDPVKRAWSHVKHEFSYHDGLFRWVENQKNFSEVSDQMWIRAVLSPPQMWLSQYDLILSRFSKHFPLNQIKVVIVDDINKDPKNEFLEILKFLGVDSDIDLSPFMLNTKTFEGLGGECPESTEKIISTIFRPSIEKTRILLEKDFGTKVPDSWYCQDKGEVIDEPMVLRTVEGSPVVLHKGALWSTELEHYNMIDSEILRLYQSNSLDWFSVVSPFQLTTITEWHQNTYPSAPHGRPEVPPKLVKGAEFNEEDWLKAIAIGGAPLFGNPRESLHPKISLKFGSTRAVFVQSFDSLLNVVIGYENFENNRRQLALDYLRSMIPPLWLPTKPEYFTRQLLFPREGYSLLPESSEIFALLNIFRLGCEDSPETVSEGTKNILLMNSLGEGSVVSVVLRLATKLHLEIRRFGPQPQSLVNRCYQLLDRSNLLTPRERLLFATHLADCQRFSECLDIVFELENFESQDLDVRLFCRSLTKVLSLERMNKNKDYSFDPRALAVPLCHPSAESLFEYVYANNALGHDILMEFDIFNYLDDDSKNIWTQLYNEALNDERPEAKFYNFVGHSSLNLGIEIDELAPGARMPDIAGSANPNSYIDSIGRNYLLDSVGLKDEAIRRAELGFPSLLNSLLMIAPFFTEGECAISFNNKNLLRIEPKVSRYKRKEDDKESLLLGTTLLMDQNRCIGFRTTEGTSRYFPS